MPKSKSFFIFIFYVCLYEGVKATFLGETSSDVTKKDCVGGNPSVSTGSNQNVPNTIGADQNIALKVQIPSLKVDPTFGGLKWDPPKLPDLFKGSNSATDGINLKTNPFTDIFKGFGSSVNNNNGFKLPDTTFKFELPTFPKPPPLPTFNLTGLTDLFHGFNNIKGLNYSFKLDSNGLPATNDAVKSLTDIFKNFKGLNASVNLDFKGFGNIKGLTTNPGFINSFWKALNCVINFTKTLNLNFKPLQNILKGFQGLVIPPNLLENLSKGLGLFKIDTTFLNEISQWINNLNIGFHIDPVKVEEMLGGIEGLEKINAFLAPYKETVAAGLGAIDAITLTELIDGILALLLIL